MGLEGVGSSVVIALAAILWLVYLIPTWFRRREYLSTERNALRLQQTMRILAETAETPEPARVEISALAGYKSDYTMGGGTGALYGALATMRHAGSSARS